MSPCPFTSVTQLVGDRARIWIQVVQLSFHSTTVTLQWKPSPKVPRTSLVSTTYVWWQFKLPREWRENWIALRAYCFQKTLDSRLCWGLAGSCPHLAKEYRIGTWAPALRTRRGSRWGDQQNRFRFLKRGAKQQAQSTCLPPPSFPQSKKCSSGIQFCSHPLKDIIYCSLKGAHSLKSTMFCINAGQWCRYCYYDYFCRGRRGGVGWGAEVLFPAPYLLLRLLTDQQDASARRW